VLKSLGRSVFFHELQLRIVLPLPLFSLPLFGRAAAPAVTVDMPLLARNLIHLSGV
jgi:hypothetical protein